MDILRDVAFEEAYSKICKPIIVRPYPKNANGEYIYKEIHEAELMWQEAKNQVPESNALLSASLDAIQKLGSGDFVLVPKELSDEKADDQAMFAWGFNLKLFKSENRYMTAIQVEEFRLRWCQNKARSLQHEYRLLIEAQEQSHE